MKPIYVVMGISGSGKSTFGALLAEKLHLPFIDANTEYPGKYAEKDHRGNFRIGKEYLEPFEKLAARLAEAQNTTGAVLACAALTEEVRTILASKLSEPPTLIYLQGDRTTIASHLEKREAGSFSRELLADQFEILEEPDDAYVIPLEEHPVFLDEVDALIEQQRLERLGYHEKQTQTDNSSYGE